MKPGMAALLLMTAPLALHASSSGPQAQAQERTWRFDVSLDGRTIGVHEFSAVQRGQLLETKSIARFRAKVLFVPLYRYDHESHETWENGCLARIEARTFDDGARLSVTGARSGNRFELTGPAGSASLSGCVKTFAYWDAGFLRQERLLNAQTGTYDPAEVVHHGRETLRSGDRTVVADRHTLISGKLRIELWYEPDGEWLALESTTPRGQRLRYERR